MTQRPALGIRILQKHQRGNRSFSLFSKNGNQFVILINYRLAGLLLRSKQFHFSNLEQAQKVFEKIIESDFAYRFSARLAQKLSYDYSHGPLQ